LQDERKELSAQICAETGAVQVSTCGVLSPESGPREVQAGVAEGEVRGACRHCVASSRRRRGKGAVLRELK